VDPDPKPSPSPPCTTPRGRSPDPPSLEPKITRNNIPSLNSGPPTETEDSPDASDSESEYDPVADTTSAPIIIDEGNYSAREVASFARLQVPSCLQPLELAIYDPLKLLLCTKCRLGVVPGDHFALAIKHLRKQDHFLFGKPRTEDEHVRTELATSLGATDVIMDCVKPPDHVILPIPLIPVIVGVACPFPGCVWATERKSRQTHHQHLPPWSSPATWPRCSIQQPYPSAHDGSKVWQVRPTWDQGAAVTPVLQGIMVDVRERERDGGAESKVLRIPENRRVLHPAHEALDWDLLIGGVDGTETKNVPALCRLVEPPSDMDPLYPVLVHGKKYFEAAQVAMRRKLDVTARQWLNSEDSGL